MTRLVLRLVSIVALFTVITSASSVAFAAAWSVTGGGGGASQAATMPAGGTTTVTVANRNAAVSWPAVTLSDGTPVDGYRVTRYDGGGVAQTVGAGCAGLVTALNCTEIAVAPGTWRYAVAPVFKSWQGAEGPRTSATIAAPQLALTGSTNITVVPGTLNGSITNFLPGQSVSFRLNDPATGTVVAGSFNPSPVPASGTADVSVAIPTTVADGNYVLYAVGGGGDVASAPFTVAAPAPTPTGLAFVNGGGGGGARKIDLGDTISVTFSAPPNVASLCSTWSGAGNQTAAGSVVIDDNAVSGNDRLRVTTTTPVCGGAFKFGNVNLGNAGFVTANTTFTATIAWGAASKQLTVTVTSDSVNAARVNSTNTALYTPDAAITGTSGRAVTGSASVTGMHF